MQRSGGTGPMILRQPLNLFQTVPIPADAVDLIYKRGSYDIWRVLLYR